MWYFCVVTISLVHSNIQYLAFVSLKTNVETYSFINWIADLKLADKFTNSCLKCCFAKFTIRPLAEIIFSISILFSLSHVCLKFGV